jgi:GT2 family glycosyltransferase
MDRDFYPVWFEDVDLCARLLASGEMIFYCPDARFHHSGAHSVSQLEFSNKQMFWYRNMVRYARKHLGAIAAGILRLSIVVGMKLRIIAALLGLAPHGIAVRDALRGYVRVGLWAFGLCNESEHRT